MASSESLFIKGTRNILFQNFLESDLIKIQILFTSETKSSSGNYICYHVSVEARKTKWLTKKRYSEFVKLDEELKQNYSNLMTGLKLPPKVLMNNFDPQLVEERRIRLANYLQLLCGNNVLKTTKEVAKFLMQEAQCSIDEEQFKKDQIEKYQQQNTQQDGSSRTSSSSSVNQTIKKIQDNRFDEEKEISRLQKHFRKTLLIANEEKTSIAFSKGEETLLEKRNKVTNEIITTERAYLNKLIYLIQLQKKKYKIPLEEAAKNPETEIISSQEITKLFGNIEEIKNISKFLFSQLNEQMNMHNESISHEIIAKIFIDMAPWMTTYTPYISNYSNFISTYAAAKSNPKFIKFEKECEKDERYKSLSLSDLAIEPIQRIPRLQLLLKELQKYTPVEDPDYITISNAVNDIERMCAQINESI